MRSLVARTDGRSADDHHPSRSSSTSHAAHKVVGVGSVGTRAWIHLFVGRDDGDPLFLQVEGGAGLRAGAVPRQEHATTTTASASSPASG